MGPIIAIIILIIVVIAILVSCIKIVPQANVWGHIREHGM